MNTTKINAQELGFKQLQRYENLIDWEKLVTLIAHDYVSSGTSNNKISIESMIRIYFLQFKFNLNATEAAIAISRIDKLRDFVLINIKTDMLPKMPSINAFSELVTNKSLKIRFENAFDIKY